MSIKYIFNGYYRSGTTLVWSIIRKSNPKYTVFYEPLHPSLSTKLQQFQEGKEVVDNLHGKKLWEEYVRQGDPFLKKITRNKISYRDVEPKNCNELFNYLDIYDSVANSILQTNRLHFHLTAVAEHYRIKEFQIVRNPVDVYKSLMRYYTDSRGFLEYIYRLLSLCKNRHSPKSNVFSVKDDIQFAYKNYNLPTYWNKNKKKLEILRDPFKTHVLSWTLANYFAVKRLKKERIINYEKLIGEPVEIARMVENQSDLKFHPHQVRKREVEPGLYKDPKIMRTVKFLEVTGEYHYILGKLFSN